MLLTGAGCVSNHHCLQPVMPGVLCSLHHCSTLQTRPASIPSKAASLFAQCICPGGRPAAAHLCRLHGSIPGLLVNGQACAAGSYHQSRHSGWRCGCCVMQPQSGRTGCLHLWPASALALPGVLALGGSAQQPEPARVTRRQAWVLIVLWKHLHCCLAGPPGRVLPVVWQVTELLITQAVSVLCHHCHPLNLCAADAPQWVASSWWYEQQHCVYV